MTEGVGLTCCEEAGSLHNGDYLAGTSFRQMFSTFLHIDCKLLLSWPLNASLPRVTLTVPLHANPSSVFAAQGTRRDLFVVSVT